MTYTDPNTPLSSLPRREAERRTRRRRHGQLNLPRDAEGRAALLASLAHRSYPTYELFVYSALAGAIIALGLLMDSQALVLFGVLVAPLFLPWIGLLLASLTGSLRFFFETLMALLLGAALVFVMGLLAGVAARAFLPRTFDQAFAHSRLWWPDLIILAFGAVILAISFIRSETKPFLPSVVIAYGFFLPLASGGFGLGSGLADLWPHGLLVFVVHFAWASLFGLAALLILRIAPPSAPALVFTAAFALLLMAVLVVLMSGGSWTAPFPAQLPSLAQAQTVQPIESAPPTDPAASASTSAATAVGTMAAAATEITLAAVAPTNTATLASTLAPLPILTIEPTSVYAQVVAPRGGAVLRSTPGGDGITTLDNFAYVEMLPETQSYSGYTWVHVIAIINGDRRDGWIVQQYLETSALGPTSGAAPSASPAP